MPHRLSSPAVCAIGALLLTPCLALCRQQQTENADLNVVTLPLSEEQQNVLDQARRYALDYVSKLPNFICRQVTHQFESGRKADHWRKLDTLGARLVYSAGREERVLETINDKPPSPGRVLRRPLQTEGEFGVLLGNVFGKASQAVISWNGWQTLRSKRVAVFDYIVDDQHSTLRLSLSDLARAVVGYHGSVYVDSNTGVVWRITNSPYDIPPEVQTRSITTTVDYDAVTIAGQTHVLPVEASVLLDTGTHNILNRMEFQDYRKFEAESKITFAASGSDADAPAGAKSRNP